MLPLSAFVLAGGRSSRMGRDKAFLELEGRTLLERALSLAASIAAEVRIVGDRSRFAAYGEVVEDVFPGRGPLGGIHAALSASRTELNLMLAVDLPFLRREFLIYLTERASQSDALVTVPRAARGLQPLCAIYRMAFAEFASEALNRGRNKIDALFTPANTLVIEEAELERLSFPLAMFDNLNTPEEAAAAAERLTHG